MSKVIDFEEATWKRATNEPIQCIKKQLEAIEDHHGFIEHIGYIEDQDECIVDIIDPEERNDKEFMKKMLKGVYEEWFTKNLKCDGKIEGED